MSHAGEETGQLMGAPRPLAREGSGEESMCGDPSRGLGLRRDWLGLTCGVRGHTGYSKGWRRMTWPGRKCELMGDRSRREVEGHLRGELVDRSARGLC